MACLLRFSCGHFISGDLTGRACRPLRHEVTKAGFNRLKAADRRVENRERAVDREHVPGLDALAPAA